MRTNIYVDGYNLYYGCLKHSPDKWLDLKQLLFARVVHEQTPHATLGRIKYYTADIKSKIASRGPVSRNAQERYHRALEAYIPDELTIIKGFYSLRKDQPIAYREPPDKTERCVVWRLEEKQTDVNLAIDSYRDAARGDVDQVVFVSNDSDIERALAAIQADFGDRIRVGVILPLRKTAERRGSRSLMQHSDWTRRYLLDEELAGSHLPDVIPRRRKAIKKPEHW